MSAHKLRVIDGHGELDESSVAIPSREHELLETIVDLRRKLTAAKGEITKLRKVDPQAETITEVLEYWRSKTGHRRAQIPLDGSRAKVVKARLANFKPEQLRAAIDAAADYPFMGEFGQRFDEPGKGRKRRDEIELLLRDERHVEDLIALGERDRPFREYALFVRDLCRWDPAIMCALAALGDEEPHGEVLARAARWARKELG